VVAGKARPVRRFLTALALGSLLQGCGPAETGTPRLAAGSAAPSFWADDATGRPVLAWVFRGDDYLGCESAAREVRRVQFRYGTALRVSMVYVGDDPERLSRFARTERINAELTRLGEREYRRVFGDALLPGFFLVRDGHVAAALSPPGDSTSAAEGAEDALMAVVGGLLEEGSSVWSGEPAIRHSNPGDRP
jgi:hypothetical protein